MVEQFLSEARVNAHKEKSMSTTISIKGQSEIYVGNVDKGLERYLRGERVVVITDANIDRLYHDLVARYDHIIIGHGEGNKNLITVQNIYSRLIEMGTDRSTTLLGIGGGIVTDITGYVASTFMRGIDFGFVATTLLGQVDASIGGKNGVNVANYKNMVGTFNQPRFVISDVEMLRTLPKRELRAGLAEVIKMAIIDDAELFNFIDNNISSDVTPSAEVLNRIVLDSVRLKSNIVERDEHEKGVRRVLNLGHTIGHAIEKCSRKLNHGEAVAIGISEISHLARRQGWIEEDDLTRIDTLLTKVGFKLEKPVAMTDILREVRYDKKKSDSLIRLVVPERIGSCRIMEIPLNKVEEYFNY